MRYFRFYEAHCRIKILCVYVYQKKKIHITIFPYNNIFAPLELFWPCVVCKLAKSISSTHFSNWSVLRKQIIKHFLPVIWIIKDARGNYDSLPDQGDTNERPYFTITHIALYRWSKTYFIIWNLQLMLYMIV